MLLLHSDPGDNMIADIPFSDRRDRCCFMRSSMDPPRFLAARSTGEHRWVMLDVRLAVCQHSTRLLCACQRHVPSHWHAVTQNIESSSRVGTAGRFGTEAITLTEPDLVGLKTRRSSVYNGLCDSSHCITLSFPWVLQIIRMCTWAST